MSEPTLRRCFVAVDFDEVDRDPLLQLQSTLRGALGSVGRWTHADDLHLTLGFLGDHDEGSLLLDWSQFVQQSGALSSCSIAFERWEVWPAAKPQVVVAVFRAHPALKRWHQALQALTQTARGTDPVPFTPHVTLLRVTGGCELPAIKLAPFSLRAARITLFCRAVSEATPPDAAPRYRRIATLELTDR